MSCDIKLDFEESNQELDLDFQEKIEVGGSGGGGVSEHRVRQIVEEATAEVANAKSAVFVDGQKVDEFNADEKFDKTGGAIGGDVSIQGNLSVSGTTTTTDTQTLRVLDNVVVANANGIPLVELSGFAIKTNADQSYGIMYDTVGDGVKIGLGGFTEDGKFVYNESEAQFLATRADAITDGHIPKWDNEKKQFVDSGVGYDEYVKFTNYATQEKAGVIKSSKTYGFLVSQDGFVWADTLRAGEYKEKAVSTFIGKGTLENIKYTYVKDGLVDNTEIWTDEDKAKACETIGAIMNPNPVVNSVITVDCGGTGTVRTSGYATYMPYKDMFYILADESQGDTIKGTGYFLVNNPKKPYHAVNKIYVDDLVGNIEAVLDSVIAIQNTLIGGGV